MPRGKSTAQNLSLLGSTSLRRTLFPGRPRNGLVTQAALPVASAQDGARRVSVGARTVLDMAEQRTAQLRVVRSAVPSETAEEKARRAYWAKVQSLRDERRRLRAG